MILGLSCPAWSSIRLRQADVSAVVARGERASAGFGGPQLQVPDRNKKALEFLIFPIEINALRL